MKGLCCVVLCCVGGGPHKEVKEIINKEEKIKVSAMQCNAKQRRRGWGSVGSVLSYLSPPPNTTLHNILTYKHIHSLFLSLTLLQLQLQKPLPHWLLLPFVSVPPMQLSMSAVSAPSSQYLQMGVESYFEFLVII